MEDFLIKDIQIDEMTFNADEEQVEIPLTVNGKEFELEQGVSVERDCTVRGKMRYSKESGHFSFKSNELFDAFRFMGAKELRRIDDEFNESPKFQEERKAAWSFIEKWSEEKPIPEIQIGHCDINMVGADDIYMRYHLKYDKRKSGYLLLVIKETTKNNQLIITDKNLSIPVPATFIGFAEKLADAIVQEARLFLLMHGIEIKNKQLIKIPD